MKSRTRISLNALRTFEAVARHGSMTTAAQELSVTPGAVSRQIAELQAALNFEVFAGSRQARTLTEDGHMLAQTLTRALDDIDATLRALDEARDATLDVACLSTMAIRWLIPRLHRFRAAHPDLDLRLSTDPRQPDRDRNRLDASILVLAPGDAPQPRDRVLFAETLGPVSAGANAGATLLTTRTRPKAFEEWQAVAAQPLAPPKARQEFEHLSLAIEAAAAGLGLCVAPHHLVASDIAAGRLTATHGFAPSGYTYVVRAHGRPKRKVAAFVDWISAEAAA